MRLLLLSSEFPPGPGGIGTHAYEVAHGLSQRGWMVCVASPQDYVEDQEIEQFNAELPFRIVRLFHHPNSIWEAITRTRTLLRLIRQWQPDLLFASGGRTVWLTAALALWDPKSWIAVGHGTEFGSPGTWEGRLTCWAFSQADGVVHVSLYTQRRARDLGIMPKREMVIPNGANAERFATVEPGLGVRFRKQLGLKDALILLTVGNVSRRKGQDIVIRALPKILDAFPHTHYVMIGLPTLQDELTQLAAQLGVSGQIHFMGRVDLETLVAGYQACDIFIMNSRHDRGDFEGYGIAVVEAALCGKPAVVSRNSGLEEAILDGVTGLAVTEADPEATAAAVIRFLDDRDLRLQYGRQAQLRAIAEQTWEQRVARYDKFFKDILVTQLGE